MTTCAYRQHLNATLRGDVFSLAYFLTDDNRRKDRLFSKGE